MSRVEILQAIRSCAKKLKHNPSRRELRLTARVSEEALHKHFGGLKRALEKAGLRPSGSGFRQQESTVLLDWARVARKLGQNSHGDGVRKPRRLQRYAVPHPLWELDGGA